MNEDGAGYTLIGVDRHGEAYKSECYKNHAQDSRVREITVAPTIPQKAGTGGNNLPITCFAKVAHPTGKNGEGERWAESEVVGTRNVFDIGETRTQECIVIERKEAK